MIFFDNAVLLQKLSTMSFTPSAISPYKIN